MATSLNSGVTVVLGGQWGDEGKGKLVDILAQQADVVARCQVNKASSLVLNSRYIVQLLARRDMRRLSHTSVINSPKAQINPHNCIYPDVYCVSRCNDFVVGWEQCWSHSQDRLTSLRLPLATEVHAHSFLCF